MINYINSILKTKDKKSIINISSYIFFILSNLIFLILIPNELSKIFFINYSIANGFLSYLVVLLFSKKENIDVKYFLFFFSLSFVYCYITKNLLILIWLYISILIYADYFFSQKKYIKCNLYIKFSLLLLSCLLLFDQFTLLLVMYIKSLFLFICITIFYILKIHSCRPLEVNRPNLYVISTCTIYFGSLFVVAYISISELIKLFYISFQVFLSFRLKLFDLNIRGILKINRYGKLLFILPFIYFMILSIYSSSYPLFILYLTSYFSLSYVEKKFIQS